MSKIIADRMMVDDDELHFRDADAQNKLKNLIVQEKGNSETAVMSQAAVTKEIVYRSGFLYSELMENKHLKPIMYDFCTKGVLYKNVNGNIVEAESVNSSGKMLAPKNLCMHYAGSTAFINFYRKNNDGSFAPDHSLLETETSSGYLHVASYASYKANMVYDIPDGMYMEICEDKGKIELYSWDGVMFGMDVSANLSYPTTSETETWLNTGGGSGVTIHGKAKHLLAKNAKIRLVQGFKDGSTSVIDTTNKKYYKLPNGYDYFRFRLETDDNGAEPKSVSGDVSDYICVVADVSEEFPISNAEKVIEVCRKVNDIKWIPAKNVVVNNNTTISYKQGVEYNGIPYGSLWSKAHYVGWHISPHTMINAANDANSIFYDPAFSELTDGAPYYSTVCSAFATMCDGWDCPQTNAGFFYDPDVETYYSYKPVLGQIYTNMYSHCVIPSKIARIENDTVVSAYESVRPVSLMTTRFMSIAWKDIWDWWNTSAGNDYYDTYGYVVYNPKSKRPIPYFGLENATITNGSARPYKGDKSVYTSAEDTVKINIKNGAATVLYLQKATGETINIPIAGAMVDVKPYLDADGIYYVYTNVDSVKESFEYVVVTPITYTVDDHALTFSDNDFWYASCYVTGHKQFRDPKYQKMTACVLAREDGDYTDWFAGTHKIIGVSGIFRKGVYGAYNVPISEVTL